MYSLSSFSEVTLSPLRGPTRARLGLLDADIALLFIEDFYRKGLGVAIDAFARLDRPDTRLVVVGRGEIAGFQARAEAAGVGDRVSFEGFQPDVRPYFAAADLFVFPTRYEPFGMVVTEAMASGLPVVTTRVAGASEVITHGVDGVLLEDTEDVAELVAALSAVLADPARRKAIGEAARARAFRVDWDYVAAETLRVYEDLLRSIGKRSALS